MKLLSFFDPDPENLNYKPDWKQMKTSDKFFYIWAYYKLPIVILAAVLALLIYAAAGYINRKNTVLYVGTANLIVPDDRLGLFCNGYTATDPSLGKRDIVSLTWLGNLSEGAVGMYLSETAVAQMKLLASVEAKQLDVILMDQAAFDTLSYNQFLLDLGELSGTVSDNPEDPSSERLSEKGSKEDLSLPEQLKGALVENTVLVETNVAEAEVDPNVELREVTQTQCVGVDLSGSPLASDLSADGKVYAGIVSNTPRLDRSLSYIAYLMDAGP